MGWRTFSAPPGASAKGRVVAVFGCGRRPGPAEAADHGPHRRGAGGSGGLYLRQSPDRTAHGHFAGGAGRRDREQDPWVAVEDRRAAIRYALDHGKPGDVIVLAGKGHETYQEIHGVKRHLDEREEVAAWLAVHYRRNEV
ncbi:MAG: glutamate ligase domain-containing protein [Oscillospiraceae bacterium]